LDSLDLFTLRRIITTLTLTLTVFSISLGQNFKKDIKDGLYLWSSGLVIQQISDTLRIFKLMESKRHYYKVADAVPDSHKLYGESHPIPSESYPISDTHKPTDILIKAPRITDIIELNVSRFSIIFPEEKGFNSANFIKCDFGYEMYLSNHDIKRKEVKESIIQDTTSYFKIYAFTLTDLRNLGQLKNFSDIDQTDFEALLNSMQILIQKIADY
jgi:hypothetical protein